MSADFLPRVSALDKITEDTELPVPPKTGSPSGLPWLKGKLVKLKGPIAAVAAVGAVLSGMVGYWSTYRTVRGGVEPAVATKALPADAGPLSIVVLPFSNLTGDPAQGYVDVRVFGIEMWDGSPVQACAQIFLHPAHELARQLVQVDFFRRIPAI